MAKKYCLVLLGVAFLFLILGFGCLQASCEKTTDCALDEVCKDGFCTKLTPEICRLENETCDVNADCCQGLGCVANLCSAFECECDDGDPCTEDSCDPSSGECTNVPIVPCCGNQVCEAGEDCENCEADCGCPAGMACESGTCTDEALSSVKSIEDEYTIEVCRQEALSEWKLKNYGEAEGVSQSCAKEIGLAIGEIEKLQNQKEWNSTQGESISVELLVLESKQNELYFVNSLAQTFQKRESISSKEYDNLEYLQDLKEGLDHLEMSMYNLYVLKKDYPAKWTSANERLFSEYGETYKGVNQEINSLYDDIGDYDYKYAFQVDPNDPVVVEIVGELGAEYEPEEMPAALLRYVYSSVDYVSDPEWQTDWVQPPAYTLMMGVGDCDDSAVLLASLFYRAGVADTYLCDVDADFDWEVDHLTVGVYDNGFMIYESVWDPSDIQYYYEGATIPAFPEPVPEALYSGNVVDCFTAEEVMSHALADKCDDGTLFGECSYDQPFFCDDGEWTVDCELCGCPEDYPNCAIGGEDRGSCFVPCDGGYGEWIEEYGVCCPEGYDDYDPHDQTCS